MRLACVFVPRFPLAVEREAIVSRPAVIYERNRVLEASPQLSAAWPGRHLRQVRALHPDALFIPADPARYHEASQAMLRALERVAPEVEPDAQGRAYVGVRGLERLFGGVGESAVVCTDGLQSCPHRRIASRVLISCTCSGRLLLHRRMLLAMSTTRSGRR